MNEKINPFSHHPAGYKELVGRHDILQNIRDLIIDSNDHNVGVIHGHRRVGKSSILTSLPEYLKESRKHVSYHCFFMNFVDKTNISVDALLHYMKSEVIQNQLLGNTFKDKVSEIVEPLDFFDVINRIDDQRIVFIFDEFDMLINFQETPDIFEFLVDVMIKYKKDIEFIVSISEPYAKLSYGTTLKDFFDAVNAIPIEIPNLSANASEIIVKLKVGNEDPEPSEDLIDKIIFLTDGHPGLVQALCQILWHTINIQGDFDAITEDSIEDAVNKLSIYAKFTFVRIWNSLDEREKYIVKIISESSDGLTYKQIVEALRKDLRNLDSQVSDLELRLILKQMIATNILSHPHNKEYHLQIPVFRNWLENEAITKKSIISSAQVSSHLQAAIKDFRTENYEGALELLETFKREATGPILAEALRLEGQIYANLYRKSRSLSTSTESPIELAKKSFEALENAFTRDDKLVISEYTAMLLELAFLEDNDNSVHYLTRLSSLCNEYSIDLEDKNNYRAFYNKYIDRIPTLLNKHPSKAWDEWLLLPIPVHQKIDLMQSSIVKLDLPRGKRNELLNMLMDEILTHKHNGAISFATIQSVLETSIKTADINSNESQHHLSQADQWSKVVKFCKVLTQSWWGEVPIFRDWLNEFIRLADIEQNLNKMYSEALDFKHQGRVAEAIEILTDIIGLDPHYKSAIENLYELIREVDVENMFEEYTTLRDEFQNSIPREISNESTSSLPLDDDLLDKLRSNDYRTIRDIWLSLTDNLPSLESKDFSTKEVEEIIRCLFVRGDLMFLGRNSLTPKKEFDETVKKLLVDLRNLRKFQSENRRLKRQNDEMTSRLNSIILHSRNLSSEDLRAKLDQLLKDASE